MPHYRASVPSTPTALGLALHRVDVPATQVGWAAVLFATALTGLGGALSVPLPGTPVPFTMQPAAVLLAGAILGARLGALSQVLYLVLGAAGASMFAISPQLLPGAARLAGPTGGFLLAFPLAAAATGWFADRGWMPRRSRAAVSLLCGLAVLYAGGGAWMAATLPAMVGATIASGLTPLVALDVVKAAAVAVGVSSLTRALGRS